MYFLKYTDRIFMLPEDFHLEKRFYYNRLDKYERELYEFWLQALLDGHQTIIFRLFRDFNAFPDENPIEAPAFFIEEHGGEHIDCFKVYNSMLWDCPELYFVYHYDPDYEISGYLRLGDGSEDYSREEINEINAWLDEFLHKFDHITDPFELELAVHDYITEHYDYDEVGSQEKESLENYQDRRFCEKFTVVGLYRRGVAVCGGLIKLIQFVLQRRGLEVADILADAGDESERVLHSWLAVKLGGNYYHLDLTYDEGDTEDKDCPQYTHFNITDEEICDDHFFSHEDYPEIVCNATEYNYYRKMGLYFEEPEQITEAFSRYIDSMQSLDDHGRFYFRTPQSLPLEEVKRALSRSITGRGFKRNSVDYLENEGYYSIEINGDYYE